MPQSSDMTIDQASALVVSRLQIGREKTAEGELQEWIAKNMPTLKMDHNVKLPSWDSVPDWGKGALMGAGGGMGVGLLGTLLNKKKKKNYVRNALLGALMGGGLGGAAGGIGSAVSEFAKSNPGVKKDPRPMDVGNMKHPDPNAEKLIPTQPGEMSAADMRKLMWNSGNTGVTSVDSEGVPTAAGSLSQGLKNYGEGQGTGGLAAASGAGFAGGTLLDRRARPAPLSLPSRVAQNKQMADDMLGKTRAATLATSVEKPALPRPLAGSAWNRVKTDLKNNFGSPRPPTYTPQTGATFTPSGQFADKIKDFTKATAPPKPGILGGAAKFLGRNKWKSLGTMAGAGADWLSGRNNQYQPPN